MFRDFETTYRNGTGDTKIEIFGFSRGAAMAREFANMIHDKYPSAKINFLGLFDTVAQEGAPNEANANVGLRLTIPNNVEFVAHAVATEEYRELFPLTSVMKYYGGIDVNLGFHIGNFPLTAPSRYSPSDYKEFKGKRYWEKPFSGAHSDVGGGYADGSNLHALRWMYWAARAHGVRVNWNKDDFNLRRNAFKQAPQYHDSRWMMDKLPFSDIGRFTRGVFSGNLEE